MRLEAIISGLVILSIFIGGFIYIMGDVNTQYGITSYNEDNLSTFQKIDETRNLTYELRDKVQNITTSPSISDKLGAFLGAGIDTAKLALQSYDTTEAMINDASEQIPIEDSSNLIQTGLVILVLIGMIFAILFIILKVRA